MKEWIKSNLWEIQQSAAMKSLGALLAMTHILTYIFWSKSTSALFQATGNLPLCWSFFDQCTNYNPFTPGQARSLLTLYVLLAGAALVIFFTERMLGFGWFFLVLCLGLNGAFYMLDFSLVDNTHVLLFTTNFIFLFVPQKIRLIRLMVLSAYLTLGILKLNQDWMAGFWLSKKIELLPAKGAEWVAALSAMIELIAPFLLFSKQWQMFASGFVALLVYHVAGWVFIDFYEPAVFCCFLLYFAINFFEQRRLDREAIYQSFLRPEPSRAWITMGLLVFALFQLSPLRWPIQELIDNPLRMRPYPAPMACQQFNWTKVGLETRELPEDLANIAATDLACNSALRWQAVQETCSHLKKETGFDSVSSYFRSRKLSEAQFKTVFETPNACDLPPSSSWEEARQ